MSSKKPLLVRDLIHGDMYFNQPLEHVIDHPLFQRLKFIVQNGICYQVFPGMTHTRFQHSLGVSHIALSWYNNLCNQKNLDLLEKMATNRKEISMSNGYGICIDESYKIYDEITKKHKTEWEFLVGVSALCHDLGHGAFSHLLEEAHFIPTTKFVENIEEEFPTDISEALLRFFKKMYSPGKRKKVDHEDITLAYLSKIFFDLAKEPSGYFTEENLHLACSLISKDFKEFYIEENKELLPLHRRALDLFISLTSGFIDADRLDYVVRDSKMAGVHLGGVEAIRITSTLIPVLYKEKDVYKSGFVTGYKHIHIVDNFFFNLYQVYTTVIYHPKALQMNSELTQLFKRYSDFLALQKDHNYINWHKNMNDLLFINELNKKEFDSTTDGKIIEKILNRDGSYYTQEEYKSVYGLPESFTIPQNMVSAGFKSVETNKREMIKDSSLLWLFSEIGETFYFNNWDNHSLISQRLRGHSFKPNICCRNKKLDQDLANLDKSLDTLKASKKTEPKTGTG